MDSLDLRMDADVFCEVAPESDFADKVFDFVRGLMMICKLGTMVRLSIPDVSSDMGPDTLQNRHFLCGRSSEKTRHAKLEIIPCGGDSCPVNDESISERQNYG